VPRFFNDDQKENRVEIRQEPLANANGNENFLKKIITGEETWVYWYDVETKMKSSLDGERDFSNKIHTDESVIDQGDVGYVFY
jgi:hypothetical protein